MPSKKSTTKKNTQNNRVYFISSSIDDDLLTLNNFFQDNKPSFIDKIYKTKILNGEISTYFINIKIINEITEEDFNKLSKRFNKILNKSYKYFYKDSNNNKFVYIPDDIINNINKSFNLFVNDD
jgi:hypothetical protein